MAAAPPRSADADYTVAYRDLGQALERLGLSEAAEAYRRGIEVADRTGDIQAGKEMRVFLTRLLKRTGGPKP